MRVLLLTPWYPDDKSPNSGAFIRSQALALSKDHEVVVISSKVNYSKFSFCSFEIKEGCDSRIKEYSIQINRSLPGYNQLNYLVISFLFTCVIARKFKPQVVHSNIGFPGGIWGWAVSKTFSCLFVFTEHTRIINNFRSFFHKRLTLFSVRRAHYCIAVSSSLATEMELWLDRSVLVIPNIVEVDRFKSIEPTDNKIPQIGFLGGMNTSVKGLDILLKSLAGIQQEFVLHIGGTGMLKAEYESLAASLGLSEKCKFYGFIPYDQVPNFMSRLHFFVCSSRYETFNVALAEAMACGLPVIATKCGGPQDFVNDVNGILVEVNDENKLREGMIWMFGNYNSFNKNEIKQFVINNFSSDKFLDRIESPYCRSIRDLF